MSLDMVSPYFTRSRQMSSCNKVSEKNSTAGCTDCTASSNSSTVAESVASSPSAVLDSRFHAQSCHELARALLGKILVRQLPGGEILKARIVETEAYPGESDRASHTFEGRKTPRNAAMYAKAGTAYVYFIYGLYHNLNISALEPGAGVLIRGAEPLEGIEKMRALRKSGAELKLMQLCNGPGKLCQAFNIVTSAFNFHDLTVGQELWLEAGVGTEQPGPGIGQANVVAANRIGIASYGDEWARKPWRYYLLHNPHVSKRDKAQELEQFPLVLESPPIKLRSKKRSRTRKPSNHEV